MQLRQFPILLLLVSGLGCDALFYDFTEVDPPNGAADVGEDQSTLDMRADIPDTDLADMRPDDMGPDLVDMGPDLVDMGPDLVDMAVDMAPPDNVCEAGGEFFGVCDAVLQDCPNSEKCYFAFIPADVRLETRCFDEADFVIPFGENCANQTGNDKCLPGLNCFTNDTCQVTCDRRDGSGCANGQFCQTGPADLANGYCVDSCD